MVSHPPKNQNAESTQQKVIQPLLSTQKNYILSCGESAVDNFQIFIKHDLKAKVEVSFQPLFTFLWSVEAKIFKF